MVVWLLGTSRASLSRRRNRKCGHGLIQMGLAFPYLRAWGRRMRHCVGGSVVPRLQQPVRRAQAEQFFCSDAPRPLMGLVGCWRG